MKRNKISKQIVAFLLLFFMMAAALYPSGTADAATDKLKIKVGFYGGPYYEVGVLSDSDMKAFADDTIYTYSAMDSGNFMRVGYAWGVPLSTLIDAVGIDLDSVKYLHFGTTDSYNEIYTTFSASTLLAKRYFYPNFIYAASDLSSSNPVLDFKKVDSSITAGAQSVPTILAIGSVELSRNEAGRVLASGGEYKQLSKSDLSEKYKYRLLYGQKSLKNGNDAYNAQTSDKWVYEINVQLGGTPNITVEKKLIEGEEGKVGSKYAITVKVDLPDSYDYLNREIRNSLANQVLSKVQTSYDQSVVKMTKTGDGTYVMEAIGEGSANISFNYSRTDYGGTKTSASGSSTMVISGQSGSGTGNGTGHGSGTGSGSGGGTGTGSSGQSGSGTSGSNGNTNSSDRAGINIGHSDTKVKDTASGTKKNNPSVTNQSLGDAGDGYTWQAIDIPGGLLSGQTSGTGEALQTEASADNRGMLAGIFGGLFTAGFIGSAIQSGTIYNIWKKRRRQNNDRNH